MRAPTPFLPWTAGALPDVWGYPGHRTRTPPKGVCPVCPGQGRGMPCRTRPDFVRQCPVCPGQAAPHKIAWAGSPTSQSWPRFRSFAAPGLGNFAAPGRCYRADAGIFSPLLSCYCIDTTLFL